MIKSWSSAEKDLQLREMFIVLKARGISSAWTASERPYTDLRDECHRLGRDSTFRKELSEYLRARTIIPRSQKMFITHYAMAANAHWNNVPDVVKSTAARGWFLGRWLPTFLIIVGPVGRFICGSDSPLHRHLGEMYPLLTGVRDFLAEKTFRTLRNGFAHWAFDWEVVGRESYVIAYDWERDLQIAKLHQREADAFHIATFSIIEVLDDVIISRRE